MNENKALDSVATQDIFLTQQTYRNTYIHNLY